MPVVEIASIKASSLDLNPDQFSVAIIEQNVLRSHRSRFCNFLKKTSGTMIHVGSPEFKENSGGVFSAGELIDWDFEPADILYVPVALGVNAEFEGGKNQQARFKFLCQFKADIDRILKLALEKSPVKKCCLFTDFYFGPDREGRQKMSSTAELWLRHDREGLVYNTMYELGQI